MSESPDGFPGDDRRLNLDSAMAEISRVSATFPDPAPRHSETSRATSVAPLAEFQQALSAALAEAFAGLRRAQDILDGDLSDQLDAALWVRRGTAASILKPQPPTLPGAVPPGCPSVLNQDSPDPLPKDAAAAALRAAAREAHRATAVEILEQPPPARPAPRLQLKDVPEALHGGRGRSVRVASPLKLSPADSRSSSWSARPPAGPAEVEPATRDHPPWEHRRNRRTTRTMSHSRVFNFDSEKDVIAHWTRIVTALEELHVSGMSMLHSSWKDAKEFTIFVANPALEAIRGDADASAVGTDFHLNGKDFKQDRPTMIWQALCYIFLLVLHPFTKYRMLWDFVGMTICFHDVTMLPAQVFVLPESYLEVRSYYEGICAAFWTIDILLNFSTGFISSEGLLEMRKEAVAQNYIRSWFFPDLVITVFDWISLIISTSSSGFLRFGKAASRSLRALRLLRMPKLNASFNQILGAMNSESLSIVAGLVKFLLILILVTHYVACAWYWLAQQPGRTWRDLFMDPDDSEVYGYFTSMHWALTQFTPASMEVRPVNVPERLFTCIVIIFALVVFSSFVSSITQAMTLLRLRHARKQEQDLLMRKYFSEFRIPQELAARCKHFMLQHQRMANKRIKEAEIPCMRLLPKPIREELRYEAFRPFLTTHPFFNTYMELCPEGLRQMCIKATDEVSLLPLEELFWNGQSVNRMFFVRIGSLSYCHRDYATLPLEVKAGQWACEEILWSKVSLVDGPFRAASAGCELITVQPTEFRAIAKVNPGPLRFCVGYAEAFVKGFNDASKDLECQDLLFNDLGTIMAILQDACVAEDIWSKLKRRFREGAKRNSVRKYVRAYSRPLATMAMEEDDEIKVFYSDDDDGKYGLQRSLSSPTEAVRRGSDGQITAVNPFFATTTASKGARSRITVNGIPTPALPSWPSSNGSALSPSAERLSESSVPNVPMGTPIRRTIQ